MELLINGQKYQVDDTAGRSLLEVLRDELDLTGSKYGCGEGQCGACTVLLEGAPIRSCSFPAAGAAGRSVTTIEGLEQEGELHPLQEAFLEAGAFQCGYCTPGMIMMGVALLNRSPQPSRREIVHFMNGNVCRCGGYQRVVAAVEQASKAIQEKEKGR